MDDLKIEALLSAARLGIQMNTAIERVPSPGTSNNLPIMVLASVLQEGPLRIGDLASRVGMTSGGMTKAIDRLELDGLVERIADVDDGRALRVAITEVGEKYMHQVADNVVGEVLANPENWDSWVEAFNELRNH